MSWESMLPMGVISAMIFVMANSQDVINKLTTGKPKHPRNDAWDRAMDERDARIKQEAHQVVLFLQGYVPLAALCKFLWFKPLIDRGHCLVFCILLQMFKLAMFRCLVFCILLQISCMFKRVYDHKNPTKKWV